MWFLITKNFFKFQSILNLLFLALLFYILLVLVKKIVKFRKLAKKVNALPGPTLSWNPISHCNILRNNTRIGQMESVIEAFNCFVKIFEKQHSLYRIWLFTTPIVIVYKADVAEKVLKSSKHMYKSSEYYFFRPWVKDSLLLSKGSKWSNRRKVLTPAFHLHILEEFLPVMNEHTSVLLGKVYKQIALSENNKSVVFDLKKLILPLTFDIICETAMGVKLNSQTEGDEYVQTLLTLVHHIVTRMISPWFWNDTLYYLFSHGKEDRKLLQKLENFVFGVIRARKLDFEQSKTSSKPSKKRRLAFLDLLLEQNFSNPTEWTDADLEEEVQLFLAAGHETVFVNIVWTLLMIANDAVIQGKVQQEIDDVWTTFDLPNDLCELTSEHLSQLPYLEACIKESMRLVPPSMTMGRYAKTDIDLEDGQVIPSGSTIMILIQMIHQDETFFPQPTKFIPDRFLDPEAPFKKNPFAYIPFSAGPRNCIGGRFAMKEAKIAIASILRHFSLEALQTVDKISINHRIVSMPKEPVNIRFIPRL